MTPEVPSNPDHSVILWFCRRRCISRVCNAVQVLSTRHGVRPPQPQPAAAG